MTEQELRELIRSQLSDINEAKKLKLDIEVPIRWPEFKRFRHNYLLLNKKYSIFKAPEYSMTFGQNKWKKETHWKHDSDDNILYVHDENVIDILLKGGAPSDLFESNTINEDKGRDLADKYVAILRKEFKKLNDDELEEFNKTIAYAFGYTVEGRNYEGSREDELAQSEFGMDYDQLGGGEKEWVDDEIANESVVNEYMDINDPVLVAIRAWKTEIKKAKAAPKKKKISTKQYYKLMDKEIDIIDQLKDATKEFEQLDSDMNQEAGQKGDSWSDDDANRYGGELDRLQTKIEKLAKQKAKVKDDIMNYRIN